MWKDSWWKTKEVLDNEDRIFNSFPVAGELIYESITQSDKLLVRSLTRGLQSEVSSKRRYSYLAQSEPQYALQFKRLSLNLSLSVQTDPPVRLTHTLI